MSDERLRELERRFRASGAKEDEAAWMTERIRCGVLPSERARVAAILGDRASLLVIGDPEARGWKEALVEHQTAVRGVLAILEQLCAELKMEPPPASVWTMVMVVRSWLNFFSPELAEQVRAAVDECEVACLCPMPQPEELIFILRLAGILGQTVINHVDGINELMSTLALCTALADEYIIEILREKLVPWLLGYGDPLNIEKASTP